MNIFQGGFSQLPNVTKNLLIINGLFFLATYLLPQYGIKELLAGYYFESPNFRWYQVITHMFLHGSFAHFFFNMFALYMFGSVVERAFGEKRFLIFYIVCGFGAFFLHFFVDFINLHFLKEEFLSKGGNISEITNLIDYSNMGYRSSDGTWNEIFSIYKIPVVGASGAIYGLLAAFALLYPNAELMLIFLPIPIKAKYFMPALIIIELFVAIRDIPGNPIAHFAHIGGALMGIILFLYWKKNKMLY